MKLIIAGGRDWNDVETSREVLDGIADLLEWSIEEVVSGGASGADAIGEAWAVGQGIPVKRFPADWDKHGRAAGPIRNREMAAYVGSGPDGGVVLFAGGKGTQSMLDEARRAGLLIFDRRNRMKGG